MYGYHFEPWNIYGRVPASRAPLSRGAYSEYSIFHGSMGARLVRGRKVMGQVVAEME